MVSKFIAIIALIAIAALLFKRSMLNRNTIPPAAAKSAMSPREAADVLGLKPGAARTDIIAAHRRLMQKIHPDHGGTTFLAQQLNEAKKVLLSHGGPHREQ